eukprot:m.457952 g.457952  ORF g.457952 m.457952 type:complete len:487 (-) comp21383_c0_seq1:337-1797(-)
MATAVWPNKFQEYRVMQRSLDALEGELAAIELSHKPRNFKTPAESFADQLHKRLEDLTRVTVPFEQQRQLLQRLFLWFCKSKECLPPSIIARLHRVSAECGAEGASAWAINQPVESKTEERPVPLQEAFSMRYLSGRESSAPERPRTAVVVPKSARPSDFTRSVLGLAGLTGAEAATEHTSDQAQRKNNDRKWVRSMSAPTERSRSVITLTVEKKCPSRQGKAMPTRFSSAWVPPRKSSAGVLHLSGQPRSKSDRGDRGVVADDRSLRRYTVHVSNRTPWVNNARPVTAITRLETLPQRRTMHSAVTPRKEPEGVAAKSSPPTLVFPPRHDEQLTAKPRIPTTNLVLNLARPGSDSGADAGQEHDLHPLKVDPDVIAQKARARIVCLPQKGVEMVGASPPRRTPQTPIFSRTAEDSADSLPRPETPVDLGRYSMQLLELVQKGGVQVAQEALAEMSLSDNELQEMSMHLAEALESGGIAESRACPA